MEPSASPLQSLPSNINTDHFWIRVLRLQPGVGTQRLECHLQLVEIKHNHINHQQYEAISYVWGSPPFHSQIWCNGSALNISPNLEQALRHVRSGVGERVLWADQICINQRDLDEKSDQVEHMSLVFSAACHVVSWIGNGSDGVGAAFPILERMAADAPDPDADEELPMRPLAMSARSLYTDGEIDLCIRLLSNPYFARAWVAQEVMKARDATLFCGDLRISWHAFALALKTLSSLDEPAYLNHRNVVSTVMIAAVYYRYRAASHQMYRIYPLLDAFRTRLTADPRDKVYAFVSMVTPLNQQMADTLRPDYRKDLRLLYMDITVQCIRQEQSLTLFSGKPPANNIPNLPSWTVDWSYTSHHDYDSGWHEASVWGKGSGFLASGPSKTNSPGRDGSALCTSGFVLDELLFVGPAVNRSTVDAIIRGCATSDGHPKRHASALRQLIHRWKLIFKSCTPQSDLYVMESRSRILFDRYASRFHAVSDRQEERYWKAMIAFDVKWGESTYGTTWSAAEVAMLYARHHRSFALARFFCRLYLMRFQAFRTVVTIICFVLVELLAPVEAKARPHYSLYELLKIGDRRFAWTRSGYWANVPAGAWPGDRVAVLAGGPVPYVLRPRSPGYCEVVGDAYIDGIMYGEAWDATRCHSILLV
jgi:Heterokaryon incompatibility protein (HET)